MNRGLSAALKTLLAAMIGLLLVITGIMLG